MALRIIIALLALTITALATPGLDSRAAQPHDPNIFDFLDFLGGPPESQDSTLPPPPPQDGPLDQLLDFLAPQALQEQNASEPVSPDSAAPPPQDQPLDELLDLLTLPPPDQDPNMPEPASDDPPTGCHVDCEVWHDPINVWDPVSPLMPNIPVNSFSLLFDYQNEMRIDGAQNIRITIFTQQGSGSLSDTWGASYALNDTSGWPAESPNVHPWQFAKYDFSLPGLVKEFWLGVHMGNLDQRQTPKPAWDGRKWDNFWLTYGFGTGIINLQEDVRCIVYGHWESKIRCIFEYQRDEELPWYRGEKPSDQGDWEACEGDCKEDGEKEDGE